MPDVTHPAYFLRLAQSIERTFNGLPQAEHLRRSDDISPAIESVVSDIAYYMIEISEELATSNRHESEWLCSRERTAIVRHFGRHLTAYRNRTPTGAKAPVGG